MSENRETVTVVLGQEGDVSIPLADAVAEYFRLDAMTKRTQNEERIFIALTMTLGTLSTSNEAQKLHAALSSNRGSQ